MDLRINIPLKLWFDMSSMRGWKAPFEEKKPKEME